METSRFADQVYIENLRLLSLSIELPVMLPDSAFDGLSFAIKFIIFAIWTYSVTPLEKGYAQHHISLHVNLRKGSEGSKTTTITVTEMKREVPMR